MTCPLVGNMRGHPGDKYVAMDVEAGVRPGENALGPFRAQQLLFTWRCMIPRIADVRLPPDEINVFPKDQASARHFPDVESGG
jgi:hypothetical protein